MNKNIFSCVSENEIKNLIKEYGEEVTYNKNEVIFSHSEFKNKIGILFKGTAKVYKGKMPLSVLESGDVFGAVTLFSDKDYFTTDIIAQSDCKIIFISKEGIKFLLKNNEKFAENYIGYLSDRIYFLNSRIDFLTSDNVENSLISFIKNNADYSQNKPFLKIKSYSELALKINSGRASLYRAMDNLEKCGIISRDGKNIYLERKD